MPYIDKEDRTAENEFFPITPGALNYAITLMIHRYLNRNGLPPGYERYNAVIGVLECAKLELYRRHVAPYEDGKVKENGDVP